MKKSLIAILLTLSTTLFAKENVIVSGKITNPKAKNVSLEIYGHNIWEPEQTLNSELNDSNSFSFSFSINELKMAYFYQGEEMSTIALEPGDSIFITLNADEFDETIKCTGIGSEKINYLFQKFLEFEDHAMLLAQNYFVEADKFTETLNKCQKLQTEFWNANKNNRKLSSAFKIFEDAELQYSFAYHRMIYPSVYKLYSKNKEYPALPEDYYSFLDSLEINNDKLLVSNSYISFLDDYNSHIGEQLEKNNKISGKNIDSYYLNKAIYIGKTLDCALMNNILGFIDHLPYNETIDYYRDFKNSCDNQLYIETVKKALSKKSRIAEGNPAPDFTLKNEKGEETSLLDYKGKVVVINFWATWCGPCIAQMPFSKKISKDFEEEDIVFLNISIDTDVEHWKSFIAENKMHGTNLNIAEGKKGKVAKSYMVDGIPQYFIIDKAGNFFSSPAPHPSNLDLTEKLIREVLLK